MASFDAAAVAMRCAAFVAALQAAGLACLWPPTGAAGQKSGAAGFAGSPHGSGSALALVLGHQVIEAARLAGTGPAWSISTCSGATGTDPPGVSALAAGVGLAIEDAGLCLKDASGRTLTVLGALGVAGSFG